MPRFTNTDVHARVWTDLLDATTHRTLALAPGESAEVVVPDGFEDPYLLPAKPSHKSLPKASEPAPTPEAEEAEPKE